LPGEKLLGGAFDFAPVLGDGVVQKLGHLLIRSFHQDERSLLVENSKTPSLDCQEDFAGGPSNYETGLTKKSTNAHGSVQ